LACFLALLKAKDPDLAQVVSAWPRLTRRDRSEIMALVKSKCGGVRGELLV